MIQKHIKMICGILFFLSVFFVAVCYGDNETEPNDTMGTASPLNPGVEMNGQLSLSSDQDWFSIPATGPALIDIYFQYSAASYTVSVQDSMGNVLSNAETSGSGPYMSFSVGVWTTGTYYVIVTGTATDPYVLTVDSAQVAYALDTSVNPAVTGQISPDCSSGCYYDLSGTSIESLVALPGPGYIFDSWSGDCTGSELSTTVVMDSSKSCSANFSSCETPPTKNGSSSFYYNSIQEAYHDTAHTLDGDTIQILAENLVESPVFDDDITITLLGGYDCTFAQDLSSSSVQGTITIERGSIILDKILIK